MDVKVEYQGRKAILAYVNKSKTAVSWSECVSINWSATLGLKGSQLECIASRWLFHGTDYWGQSARVYRV